MHHGVLLHEILEIYHHRIGSYSNVDHCNFCLHEVIWFYVEQFYDACARPHGGRRNRRRDCGARKRVSLHRRKGMSPYEASIEGTREIVFAVLATTLSLVIVFLPVSFLSSVTGRLLFEFGVTATVAILISMFISFTLTPMMCSRLLKPIQQVEGQTPKSRQGFYRYIESSYMWTLRVAMRFRLATLLVSAAVIASNYYLYQIVQRIIYPNECR